MLHRIRPRRVDGMLPLLLMPGLWPALVLLVTLGSVTVATADEATPTHSETAPLSASEALEPTRTPEADASATPSAAVDPSPEPSVNDLFRQLPLGNFNDRRDVAKALGNSGDPRVAEALSGLADGRLLATRDDPPRILLRDAEGNAGIDVLTGERLTEAEMSTGRRIPVHNPLRNALRSLVAVVTISAPDPAQRIDALGRLIRDGVDPEVAEYLEGRLSLETDARALELLQTLVALNRLAGDDPVLQLEAVGALRNSLLPEVRQALTGAAQSTETSAQVQAAATEALDDIESKTRLFRLTENLFFGLSAGSVLLLAAIGLAITFGVMGVINMAHGELIMIGAYTTWFIQTLMPEALTASILLAIPAAFVVAGLIGIAMERSVIQFLYGRPLETLLATFGISLILQQAVRSLFSPLNRPVASPDWISGSLEFNPILTLTWSRLYSFIFAIRGFVALLTIMKKTDLGLKVRAVAQNRPMARALGIRTGWVDALTFGLGAGIAGVAGVALSQLTNVGPNMGQAYIIDSFMVVVFGGVGNLWGTLVGAMGLGMMTKFIEPYYGAVLAKIIVLIFIILFIQRRPRGLFPKKGRAAEA